MIDIDYFKKINDTYGHHAGDFILIFLVKKIEGILRKSDVFSRIGGEEFTILLNDTSLYGAKVIADKIRQTIEDKMFMYKELTIGITVSIGISVLNKEYPSIESLYKQADKQLYIAKESGRNRVSS
ncbi:GGDEF domain-containing protein [Colwellia sp. 20A7]|uniref:GGDEF domain-containing protein n=1 Tax=Colwellia sp. 20A7 TaxID=2689569 RepID=UPI00135B96D5|nr:GGDEF domain-containing protein [Colwellia sp. 20A7]